MSSHRRQTAKRSQARERRLFNLVLYGLLSLLLVGIPVWFLDNFERRLITIETGYSAEALRHPWLAFERFLVAGGVPVERGSGQALLMDPPSTTDTLVVRSLGSLNDARRAALRRWIEGGGHLVAKAANLWGQDETPRDDLLAEFGVRRQLDPSQCDCQGEDSALGLTEIRVQGIERPLKVRFDPRHSLIAEDASPADIWDGDRLHLVRRSIGSGRLTVLAETSFMRNQNIGQQDHALFAARLVEPRQGGKVWLIDENSMPGLLDLIWMRVPLVVISAGVLLLMWLWSLSVRLGPLLSDSHERRRDLLEHLNASGDFLWRHGRAAHLVEASRQRILSAWLRRHPHLDRSDRGAQTEAIAQASGWSAERVSRALFARAEDASGFIEQGQLLRSLWRRAGPRHGSKG